jgi:hypothetical protein
VLLRLIMSPAAAELVLRRLARKCRDIARMPAASAQTAIEMRKMASEFERWSQRFNLQIEVRAARSFRK